MMQFETIQIKNNFENLKEQFRRPRSLYFLCKYEN